MKMLPAKPGHKRRAEPRAKRAVELARLSDPRVNPRDLDSVTRAIIGAQIGVRLMCPETYAELGITAQEAVELAMECHCRLLEKYGDRAERVIQEAFELLAPKRETVEIDAECYAKHLLAAPLARRTAKWTARDFLVAVFLHRAANHHVDDDNLLRGLAQELCSVILDELGGCVATKKDCQRPLWPRAVPACFGAACQPSG
jgi:hypothetical protein